MHLFATFDDGDIIDVHYVVLWSFQYSLAATKTIRSTRGASLPLWFSRRRGASPRTCSCCARGPGMSRKGPDGWSLGGAGGRLYLADGLVDLSYGPHDVRPSRRQLCARHHLPQGPCGTGRGKKRPPELQRFSLILFSRMCKAMGPKRICKHGNYVPEWKEEMRLHIIDDK